MGAWPGSAGRSSRTPRPWACAGSTTQERRAEDRSHGWTPPAAARAGSRAGARARERSEQHLPMARSAGRSCPRRNGALAGLPPSTRELWSERPGPRHARGRAAKEDQVEDIYRFVGHVRMVRPEDGFSDTQLLGKVPLVLVGQGDHHVLAYFPKGRLPRLGLRVGVETGTWIHVERPLPRGKVTRRGISGRRWSASSSSSTCAAGPRSRRTSTPSRTSGASWRSAPRATPPAPGSGARRGPTPRRGRGQRAPARAPRPGRPGRRR